MSLSRNITLNSCKGIIRDRMLKHETEENITEYLNTQGVTACKRFKIKKDGNFIETNTLLLTFNTTTLPKSLKIFYRIIPVEVYIPNPLRCFNCQRFGHHENGCPELPGSVCEKCRMGDFDHSTNACKNEAKCVNCHKNHQSKSNQCEIWKKEKEIMKIKVTQKITYLEAKKIQENQPEITFAKVVQSLNTKPETKESSTQFNDKDSVIKANSKVITPTVKPKPKPTSTHQSRPPTKSQNSSQTQPTKTSGSQQRSRSRTAVIRDAFIKKEHVVAVFFDLEKAYDTTWKHGIMKDLHKLGLKGRLPLFIQNFLSDRTFNVRIGNTLSDIFKQEQGVPQGSILSPTLFGIKINDIVKCVKDLDCSLFVDDFGIFIRSKNMETIEFKLQRCLNNIEDWATENGFKFSKTNSMRSFLSDTSATFRSSSHHIR